MIKDRHRRTLAPDLRDIGLERQVGYLVRAVEDLSDKTDERSMEDKAHKREVREDIARFKREVSAETCSLKKQVNTLTGKVEGLEKSIKRSILSAGFVIAVGVMALGKLEPSTVISAFSALLQLFT